MFFTLSYEQTTLQKVKINALSSYRLKCSFHTGIDIVILKILLMQYSLSKI